MLVLLHTCGVPAKGPLKTRGVCEKSANNHLRGFTLAVIAPAFKHGSLLNSSLAFVRESHDPATDSTVASGLFSLESTFLPVGLFLSVWVWEDDKGPLVEGCSEF